MARTAFLVLAGLVSVIAADKPKCKAEATKAVELQKQVDELRIKFDAVKQGGASTRFSVIGAAATAKNVVGSAFQSALDSTDIDEKLTEKAAAHYETARAFTVDAMGKVSALDYKEHVKTLTEHAVYKEHVAPVVESAMKKAEPHMTQHVKPVLESHVYPAMDKATAAWTNTVQALAAKHKIKALEHLSTVPGLCSQLEAKVGDFLAPVFAAFAKVSPDHESMMPSGGVDRVLFLFVLLAVTYYFLFLAKFAIGVTLSVLRKSTSLALKLVFLPLRIIFMLLSVIACFATCFYCCGLCRKKSSVKDSKKGDTSTAKKDAGKVTSKDLTQLLEASKKKGKLDEAVKLLSSKVKDGKPLDGKSFPENVKGKTLDKATLKTACGNFKEIDVKKL